MVKTIISVIALALIGVGVYSFLSSPAPDDADVSALTTVTTEPDESAVMGDEVQSEDESVVPEGEYRVRVEESVVRWAGKKPLVSGYTNDGSLAISEGAVRVVEGIKTGEFTINMDTLSANSTPTKPGQESTLEGHLKGERWFDVATHPTATVTIDEANPEGGTQYTITGTLTMKGETNPITFPATITVDEAGVLRAEASFEIDRTLWGITAGSGSFFDNLADNVIDDMIALSFTVVADRQ